MSATAYPMRVLLMFLAWGLALGCVAPKTEPVPPTAPSAPAGTVRFLSFGDSYTIGQSVPSEDRWSVQLARLAQTEGLQAPDIIAQTGWTTQDLQQAITRANNQNTYELVSLMIGVNNQFQGRPLATYRAEFRQLLQTAIRFAGGRPRRVFVLSVPDWGKAPYARNRDQARISQEIDQFNAVAREECASMSVEFVDITELTRTASGDASQFATDGLHYSGMHMRQWAERALPVVRQLLK